MQKQAPKYHLLILNKLKMTMQRAIISSGAVFDPVNRWKVPKRVWNQVRPLVLRGRNSLCEPCQAISDNITYIVRYPGRIFV